MNRSRQVVLGTFSGIGLLLLILDGKTAFQGASEGVELCLKTVIPSLFPFFVLSAMVNRILSGHSVGWFQPLFRLLGIPSGGESILLLGLLGGYPTGAQCIAQNYNSGNLSRQEGHRLLAFCSNAGPAFIFGILGPLFSSFWIPWVLWAIQMSSAFLVGAILPKGPVKCIHPTPDRDISFPEALKSAISTTGAVCGWIILFRVILAFLERWILWMFPKPVGIALAGILELTNGCQKLGQIQEESLRFLYASGFLSFGGCCVLMQTASVTESMGLGFYLHGKLLQTLISFTMAGIWTGPLFGVRTPEIRLVIPAGIACFSVFLWILGFNSRNLRRFGV